MTTFLTQAQARLTVYTQWKTGWDALHPQNPVDPLYVPYVFENGPFVEPISPQPWARVSLRHDRSDQETLNVPGKRLYVRPAMIWVQFFGPNLKGLGGLDVYCDEAKSFLEGVSFGGIESSGGADVQEIGDDGRWYEVVLVIPITYYSMK